MKTSKQIGALNLCFVNALRFQAFQRKPYTSNEDKTEARVVRNISFGYYH